MLPDGRVMTQRPSNSATRQSSNPSRQPGNQTTWQPKPANRFANIELSLIRQINALATPLSVNLGIGEPNVEPDETLREFAVRAAASGSWHYTANPGNVSLRTLIAGESGFEPQSEVCVTAGTEEALFSVFQAYVDPGDEVLVPNPGFLAYATLARIAGATPVSYELEPGSAGVSPAVDARQCRDLQERAGRPRSQVKPRTRPRTPSARPSSSDTCGATTGGSPSRSARPDCGR